MKCPKCSFESDNEKGVKSHMTSVHGSYNLEDLKAAGITPNERDIARSLAGNASASEVSQGAPESEPKPGDKKPTTRRSRSTAPVEDPAVAEAKAKIIRARCQRIASLPYSLLASLLGDESLKLDFGEEQMLTESYVCLANAYGWEGTSKLILWGDVLIVNAAVIARRKDAVFNAIGVTGQPTPEEVEAGKQAPKETVQ